jgi:hypothetical protein
MEDGMVIIYFPRSEAELASAVSLLETHSIPLYVRTDQLAGAAPGFPPGPSGVRAVMVPFHQAARARDLLLELPPPAREGTGSGRSGAWVRLWRGVRALLPGRSLSRLRRRS